MMKFIKPSGTVLLISLCCPAISATDNDNTGTVAEQYRIVSEATLVADLFDYTEQLHQAQSDRYLEEYKTLEQKFIDCDDPGTRLKFALLIGGIAPDLINTGLARKLFEGCLQNRGPVLSGYIRSRLRDLEKLEQQQDRQQVMRDRIADLQRENLRLNERILSLEEKMKALTDIEQNLQNREQTQ